LPYKSPQHQHTRKRKNKWGEKTGREIKNKKRERNEPKDKKSRPRGIVRGEGEWTVRVKKK